jgi:DNA-binding SARP family transcriptional activator
LRRGRVRALLELLVLRSPIERDRAVELMWPDADVDSGRQNLRVTLTRLRRAFADAGAGGSRSPIEADRDRIQLGPTHLVDIDLAEFRRHVVTAERHRTAGDSASMIDALASAVALWRGDPFDDLATVVGLEAEVEHVRRELVEAGLRLGEALIVAGRFDEVLDSVERCLAAAPYDERAHRLAIAAHMHRRDRRGLDDAVACVLAAVDDVGAEPEPATRMLLRRAADGRVAGGDAWRDGRTPS